MQRDGQAITYDEFNQFCGSLPAATHCVQWRGSQVWKIGGKIFAIGGWSKTDKPAYTFKTSEQNYHYLSELAGYQPAPYLAARGMKWIQQFDAPPAHDGELKYYIEASHRLVSLGLTKKLQKELGLNGV